MTRALALLAAIVLVPCAVMLCGALFVAGILLSVEGGFYLVGIVHHAMQHEGNDR